jgi:hypothetical protein
MIDPKDIPTPEYVLTAEMLVGKANLKFVNAPVHVNKLRELVTEALRVAYNDGYADGRRSSPSVCTEHLPPDGVDTNGEPTWQGEPHPPPRMNGDTDADLARSLTTPPRDTSEPTSVVQLAGRPGPPSASARVQCSHPERTLRGDGSFLCDLCSSEALPEEKKR